MLLAVLGQGTRRRIHNVHFPPQNRAMKLQIQTILGDKKWIILEKHGPVLNDERAAMS